MTTKSETERKAIRLAKSLAPEELAVGDFVAILRSSWELPSFLWHGHPSLSPYESVRIEVIPDENGLPFKVKAVCLPFVLVQPATGSPRSLDVRVCQLARLDRWYAKAAWKAFRSRK